MRGNSRSSEALALAIRQIARNGANDAPSALLDQRRPNGEASLGQVTAMTGRPFVVVDEMAGPMVARETRERLRRE